MRYPAITFLGSAATRRYPLLTTISYTFAEKYWKHGKIFLKKYFVVEEKVNKQLK